jgi:rRNA biogenesis protein RRP5
LDLGVKSLTGFLPLKESKSYIKKYNRDEELAVGQYVECVIEKVDTRTANVSIDRTKIATAVVEDPFSRITSILPGQSVTGVIDAVQSNGLGLKMQGLYPVTIDQSHIPAAMDIEKDFKLGQNITFRTLFTILNTDEKKIGGSVLSHILELDVPTVAPGKKSDKFITEVFPAGSFLDNVKVARVSSAGVWVTLDGVDGVSGYVHISRLADEHVASVSATTGKFKIGSTHRARVLTYNPVDALLVLTLEASVLAEKFLRVADIEIGSMVECEVERLIPAGIIVKVSKSISGLVPTVHMADVKLTRPEFKFKVGKKIQCRVLKTDLLKQKVFLTLKKSLINSEYPIFKDIAECKVDDVSHGVIIAIKNNGCVVSYYNNLAAFAPGNEMTETRVANLGEIFNVGQTVKTTVLRVDPEENKMLVSFINTKKKAEKQAEKKAKLDAKHEAKNDALAPGKLITATIKSIKKNHLTLSLPNDVEGRVHITEVYNTFDEIKNLKNPLSQFRSKQEIQVKVLGVRNTKLNTYLPITRASKVKQHVDCSLRLESEDDSAREIRNVKAGEEFIGFISDIHSAYVHVSIGTHTAGTMQKQLASSDPNVCNNLAKHFVSGQAIRAVVLAVDANKNTIDFMNAEDASAPRITDISALKEGQVMNAVIKHTNKVTGVLVNITSKIAGKAYLTDLADTYTEDPIASCVEGQVVRVAIVNVNKERSQVDVSLRPSRIFPDIESNEVKSFEDIKRGTVYEGYVSNIAPVGVFIKLNHSIAARVKIANLSDSFVKEWKDIYKLGQLVKVKIIYIDHDMKRLEASLKKSVVEGTSAPAKSGKKEQQVEDSDSDEEMPEVDDSDEDEEMQEASDNEDEEAEEAQESEEESEEENAAPAAALSIDNFDWTGINNRVDSSDEEEESDDEDEDTKSKDKKKKKEVQDLTAELNTNAPQTAADFERLLVGSPNSSYLWINFMAYQLQLSEIAKARDIGERALKTISFREEQEKMNVWVALLNLENNFGTEETLQDVFKRALVYCDPLKVYLQLVKIYERSEKEDKAEALWEEMTKKFGQSPEVWTGFGLYYLQHNNADNARELLQKSLKVLPKHEHVQTIVKFAQLEFKHGEAERGRTILEGVMSNYPKRLDLWSIYLDMEIKAGDFEMAR